MFLLPIYLLLFTSSGFNNSSAVPVENQINKAVLLELVNKVRKNGCKCGDTWYPSAPAVTWNNQLEAAAAGHSKNMHQKKFFSHKGTDGSDGGDRIARTGYRWTAYGENIANGYLSEREVILGWLASPGHCRNIMNRKYKEMGVARMGRYWTQTFGAR